MDTVELLLHPVRLRIAHALYSGEALTISQLCQRLPDVSQASVYRHVGLLTEGELLEVASEKRVRGAVERCYRLRRSRARIDAEAGAEMSLEEHHRGFTAAMAALIAEFGNYLASESADPYHDSVSYRQATVWLSDAELAEYVAQLTKLLRSVAEHEPAQPRRPYLLGTILFPSQNSRE